MATAEGLLVSPRSPPCAVPLSPQSAGLRPDFSRLPTRPSAPLRGLERKLVLRSVGIFLSLSLRGAARGNNFPSFANPRPTNPPFFIRKDEDSRFAAEASRQKKKPQRYPRRQLRFRQRSKRLANCSRFEEMQALQLVAAKQEAAVGRVNLPDMLQRNFLEAALGSAKIETSGTPADSGATAPVSRDAASSTQISRVIPSSTSKEAGGVFNIDGGRWSEGSILANPALGNPAKKTKTKSKSHKKGAGPANALLKKQKMAAESDVATKNALGSLLVAAAGMFPTGKKKAAPPPPVPAPSLQSTRSQRTLREKRKAPEEYPAYLVDTLILGSTHETFGIRTSNQYAMTHSRYIRDVVSAAATGSDFNPPLST